MAYFKNGAFADDPFADTEILSGPEWLQRRCEALPSPDLSSRSAIRLDPGFDVEAITGGLDRVSLIKVAFPKFTDGRGYSMGWLLRARLGFTGEMRAIGDVLFDEMQLMMRCGFDAFEIKDVQTLRLLEDGRRASTFQRFYQPGLEPEMPAGTRPWARRSV